MKIAVLGAGPGGYEAAIYAAKKGAEVVLIDKDSLGGTCLNRGCIPTKAFLASADVLRDCQDSRDFGIELTGDICIDYPAILERKNKVVTSLVKGIQFLCDKAGVKVVKGFGSLTDSHTISVAKDDGTTEEVTADYIILATGSVPTTPGMFKYDKNHVITSDEVLDLPTPPKSLILMGGGVIGVEIGQFLAKMGTAVTVVEMLPQLLPTMDEDVAKQLARQFKKDKIKVIVGDGIAQVDPQEDSVKVTLQSGKELEAEYALVAIGRRPYLDPRIGFDKAGVEITERGRVKVDEHLKTTCDNIYAIGDILDSAMLAHVASKEGLTAVDNIFGAQKVMSYKAVPGCVFTYPEIATAGATEAELKKAGREYKLGTFDLKGLGKAQASGHIAGFVKVIADENDVLIGAAIVGAHAADMLQVLTTAIELGLTCEQVADSIFPHPTMCEAIVEALHDVHGLSVHKI